MTIPKSKIEKNEYEPSPDNEQPLAIAEVTFRLASLEASPDDRLHFAAAGAVPYEGSAKVGLRLEGADYHDKAIAYAQGIFPDVQMTYIGAGKHGVTLKGSDGRAYKVYRSSLEYSRTEKEAGALQLLSQAGLAPKFYMLVDAKPEYRLDRKAYDYTTFGFEDVVIPRSDRGSDLPILVMDYVEAAEVESATPESFSDGFCKVLELFVKEGIRSWDTEFMVNKDTGSVTALDVGELYQRSTRQTGTDELGEIISGLCLDFGVSRYETQVAAAYASGGIAAVRELPVLQTSAHIARH